MLTITHYFLTGAEDFIIFNLHTLISPTRDYLESRNNNVTINLSYL